MSALLIPQSIGLLTLFALFGLALWGRLGTSGPWAMQRSQGASRSRPSYGWCWACPDFYV